MLSAFIYIDIRTFPTFGVSRVIDKTYSVRKFDSSKPSFPQRAAGCPRALYGVGINGRPNPGCRRIPSVLLRKPATGFDLEFTALRYVVKPERLARRCRGLKVFGARDAGRQRARNC
jgi:hypothetical protein